MMWWDVVSVIRTPDGLAVETDIAISNTEAGAAEQIFEVNDYWFPGQVRSVIVLGRTQ